MYRGYRRVLAPILLLALLPFGSESSVFVQTDWSEPGADLPVREWADDFDDASGVSLSSFPGSLVLGFETTEIGLGGVGAPVAALSCADLDLDGDCDIAAATGDRIVWFDNLGGGRSFAVHPVLPPGSGTPSGLVPLDSDGDGDIDLAAVLEPGGSILLLRNDGFDIWPVTTLAGGVGAAFPVVGDFDGDGLDDLAVLTGTDPLAVVLLNPGSAGGEWVRSVVAQAHVWDRLFAGDVQGDGTDDLLISVLSAGIVRICTMIDGGWVEWSVNCPWPSGCAVADLLADSPGPETVLSSSSADTVFVVTDDGSGRRALEPLAGGLLEPRDPFAGDFDGDGDEDLAAFSSGLDELSWWENTSGGFELRFGGSIPGVSAVACGDLDGDGADEPVTGTSPEGEVSWWDLGGFEDRGEIVSSILLVSEGAPSATLTVDADTPPGTSVQASVRISRDRTRMGDWIPVSGSEGAIAGFPAHGHFLLQYRLVLESMDPSATPVVREVRLRL